MTANDTADKAYLIPGRYHAAIGRRMRLVMHTYGIKSQKEFCEKVGMRGTLFSDMIANKKRISLAHAFKVKELYGVDLDWIYEGEKRGLSYEAAERLTAAYESFDG